MAALGVRFMRVVDFVERRFVGGGVFRVFERDLLGLLFHKVPVGFV